VDQWLDWPAFGFLALLTCLDGLRRVPAGAFVLRRILFGKWEVVPLREGYGMVSWWPPLTTTVILAPEPRRTGGPLKGLPRDLGVAQSLADRRTESPRGTGLLHALGLLGLVTLVVVVPTGMRWWGGLGFLASLAAVILLSGLIAALSFYVSKPLGLSTRERVFFSLPRLNPFAAPAAGEALLERSLAGANPFLVARALMEQEDFLGWIRPTAYDIVHGEEVDGAEALLEVSRENELKELVNVRPARVAAHSKWCPRCGSEFEPAISSCSSCEIPLRGGS
jgi:hypothetical protein